MEIRQTTIGPGPAHDANVSAELGVMTGHPRRSTLVPMDALLAHDCEHARQLDPAEKLQQALDVMRAGIRLKRSSLRRQFPEATETEVDHRLAEWLRGDG